MSMQLFTLIVKFMTIVSGNQDLGRGQYGRKVKMY